MEKRKKHITLEEVNKEIPFHVPDHYFKDLPGIIQSRTSAAKHKRLDLSFLFAKIELKYALLFIAIVVGSFTFWNAQQTKQISLSSLSDEEILNYLYVYEDDISEIYASAANDEIDINMNEFIEVDNNLESLYFDENTDDFLNKIELEKDLDENSILLL